MKSQNNRLFALNAGWTPTWLIRDEFTDTVAAGSVNGTAATPGPGDRFAADTESKMSVGGGVLAISGGKASPSSGDPGLWYGAQARAAGLLLIVKNTWVAAANYFDIGFDSNTSGTPVVGVLTAGTQIRGRPESALTIGAIAESTAYIVAVILRSNGHFLSIRGGSFAEWAILWVSSGTSTTPIYPTINNYDATTDTDYVRVTQLPAPFNSDTGLATDSHAGAVSAGTTFTHEADTHLYFVVSTLPSAGSIDVVFRKLDADNYWIARINSSGDLSLQKVENGNETQPALAAGVVSAGHRVAIIANDTSIRGLSNNASRWTYGSASLASDATAGEVASLGTGGAISNLETYPVYLSGRAKRLLDIASA